MTNLNQRNVGDNIQLLNQSWTFGGKTPENFEEHIKKSIPLYEETHQLILQISEYFVSPQYCSYDLGCSTGNLIFKMNSHYSNKYSWVGIDKEQGMIEKAKKNLLAKDPPPENIQFIEANIKNFSFGPSNFITSIYTLQFEEIEYRKYLLEKIYRCLKKGGGLILFEKIREEEGVFQELTTQIYFEHKLDKGFLPEEILTKARGLKSALRPLTSKENKQMLEQIGFKKIMVLCKYLCFEGLLCIK